MVYSPKPRSDVFCFKLNFKISKLGYWSLDFLHLLCLVRVITLGLVNYTEVKNALNGLKPIPSLVK